MKKTLMKLLLLLLPVIAICMPAILSCAKEGDQKEKIRVAWLEIGDYQKLDENNNPSGYLYDYLSLIAQYNNWEYEFVTSYEEQEGDTIVTKPMSFDHAYQMICNGEVDLMGNVFKTEEREETALFSKLSLGTMMSCVVAPTEKGLTLEALKEKSHITAAHIEMGSARSIFSEFARKNGITVDFVAIPDRTQLIEAIETGVYQNKTIDVGLINALNSYPNLSTIEIFDVSPFYLITGKQNTDLMGDIDNTLAKINIMNPQFQSDLRNSYFLSYGANLSFTKEEQEYATSNVIRVAFDQSYMPLYMVDSKTGEVYGILDDIYKRITEISGLQFEYVLCENEAETLLAIKEGKADILGCTAWDPQFAKENNLSQSITFLGLPCSVINNSEKQSEGRYGILRHGYGVGDFGIPEGATVIYFDNAKTCVEALLEGEIDKAIMNSYSAGYYMDRTENNRLQEVNLLDQQVKFCCAISNRVKSPLLSTILNKSFGALSQTKLSNKMMEYSWKQEAKVDFAKFMKDPRVIAVIMVIGILLAALGGNYYYTNRQKQMEEEKNKELDTFISYMCETCDNILEVQVGTKQCYRYINTERYENLYECLKAANRYTPKISHEMVAKSESTYSVKRVPITVWDVEEYLILDRKSGKNSFETLSAVEQDNLQAIVDNKETVQVNGYLRMSNGSLRWHNIYMCGMEKTAKRPNNLMIILRDRHNEKCEEEDQKELFRDLIQNAVSANESKTKFLSKMSHELRTPLNGIMGYVALAEKSSNDEMKVREYLLKVDKVSKNLLSTINNILDITKIESGDMALSTEPFWIQDIADDMQEMFSETARIGKVRYEVLLQCDFMGGIIGDKSRIEGIVINLLGNSFKFTLEGGSVTLEILQRKAKRDVVWVIFTITDTGIGMSKDFLEKLWDPYTRERDELTKSTEGNGLGLSIVKNLVMMMNGKIDVKSRRGHGSKFTVTIPFRASDEDTELAGHKVETKEDIAEAFRNRRDKVTVLLAEDNDMNAEIAGLILEDARINVVRAKNGKEAVNAFLCSEPGTYQAILMDVVMPVMSGYEATAAIRSSKHQEARTIPIIALSANAFMEDIQKSKDAGMNDHISKPLEMEQFFGVLKKYIPEEPSRSFRLG